MYGVKRPIRNHIIFGKAASLARMIARAKAYKTVRYATRTNDSRVLILVRGSLMIVCILEVTLTSLLTLFSS